MPVILSLAVCGDDVVGAGPEGFFVWRGGELLPLPQPMAALYGCAVAGDRLIVTGAPFGTASRRIVEGDVTREADVQWQGGWMDHTSAPVLTVAAMPAGNGAGEGDSPTLLAATAGDGILRTSNRGANWSLCNFGLQEYVVLSLAWSPAPSHTADGARWLERQAAFAGSETGVYRSPAAGLAWKRVEAAPQDAVQAIAVSLRFHQDGVVVLGTENSGIWRSDDGGRSFGAVAGSPARVDALIATGKGFLAGTPAGILVSRDGVAWAQVDARPALALLARGGSVFVGSDVGVFRL